MNIYAYMRALIIKNTPRKYRFLVLELCMILRRAGETPDDYLRRTSEEQQKRGTLITNQRTHNIHTIYIFKSTQTHNATKYTYTSEEQQKRGPLITNQRTQNLHKIHTQYIFIYISTQTTITQNMQIHIRTTKKRPYADTKFT